MSVIPLKYVSRVLRYLRPHWRLAAISAGLTVLASLAALLTPWPLKIVFDHVSKPKGAAHGRLGGLLPADTSPQAVLQLVAVAVIAIALLDALCSYAEKYTTTSVGQWVRPSL